MCIRDRPYTKVEDLAVVYQILMDKNAEGTVTITITDNLMDRYGTVSYTHLDVYKRQHTDYGL